MSQNTTDKYSQVQPPNGIEKQRVNPEQLIKSKLLSDDQPSKNTWLKQSIEDIGVLIPVLARKEAEQWAVVDGWERVLNAREAHQKVPIWTPKDGDWSDEQALRARLFANTAAHQNQLDWLRRAWLLEDAWEKIGSTRETSPSGVAELVNIPESTARYWIEPVRGAWTDTIIDRELYEDGQVRKEHGNDKYIKQGVHIEEVTKKLGTRKLIDIRTRSKFDDEIKELLLMILNGEIKSDEFSRAKDLSDEDNIPLLPAVKEVLADQDDQISPTLVGDTASQASSIAKKMGMSEEEFLKEAAKKHVNQANIDGEGYHNKEDSGYLRQQSYLDKSVDDSPPEPDLRMKPNKCLSECPANSVHLTVTSPPYNVAWDYSTDQSDDREYYQEYLGKLIADTFREIYHLTVDGGYCCIVVPLIYDVADSTVNTTKGTPLAADMIKVLTGQWAPTDDEVFSRLKNETTWEIETLVTWYKGYHDAGLRDQDWIPGEEPLLNPENPLNNFSEAVIVLKKPGERDVSQEREQQSGIVWKNDVEDRDLRANHWKISPTSWEPKYTDQGNTAQFPEELAKRCILHWSYVRDTVLDPFCGRGTTLKMAKRHYRESIGYEIQEELERDIREYVGMN
jgi:site-specific DNA-methyltransferase (adenine-specific)